MTFSFSRHWSSIAFRVRWWACIVICRSNFSNFNRWFFRRFFDIIWTSSQTQNRENYMQIIIKQHQAIKYSQSSYTILRRFVFRKSKKFSNRKMFWTDRRFWKNQNLTTWCKENWYRDIERKCSSTWYLDAQSIVFVHGDILKPTNFDAELPRFFFVKNDAFHVDLSDFRTIDISNTKQIATFSSSNTAEQYDLNKI